MNSSYWQPRGAAHDGGEPACCTSARSHAAGPAGAAASPPPGPRERLRRSSYGDDVEPLSPCSAKAGYQAAPMQLFGQASRGQADPPCHWQSAFFFSRPIDLYAWIWRHRKCRSVSSEVACENARLCETLSGVSDAKDNVHRMGRAPQEDFAGCMGHDNPFAWAQNHEAYMCARHPGTISTPNLRVG